MANQTLGINLRLLLVQVQAVTAVQVAAQQALAALAHPTLSLKSFLAAHQECLFAGEQMTHLGLVVTHRN